MSNSPIECRIPNLINPFITVICMLLITVIHARNECDCECFVPYYARTDICKWLNFTSPKVDNNLYEIKNLKRENKELMNFKNNYKQLIKQEIEQFITQQKPSFWTELLGGNEEIPKGPSVELLTTEIENLKKEFKEEQNALVAQITTAESNLLKIKNELEAKVNAAEDRAFQAENDLLGKINEAQNEFSNSNENLHQTIKAVDDGVLKLKDEFSAAVNDVGKRLAEIKNELSVKVNQSGNQYSASKEELLKKVKEVEDRLLKGRENLLTELRQVDDALKKELESERRDRTHLEDMLNNTENRIVIMAADQEKQAVAITREISSSAENLKAYIYDKHLRDIYHRIHVLEKEKYGNLDNKLEALEAKIGNYKGIDNNVSILNTSYGNLRTLTYTIRDDLKNNFYPTVEELRVKATSLEEELAKLSLEKCCSNITDMWFVIESIEKNQQRATNELSELVTSLEIQLDQMKKNHSFPIPNNVTLFVPGASETTCDEPSGEYEITRSGIFSGFGGYEKCGDVQLYGGKPKLRGTLIHTHYAKPRKTPRQVMLLLQKKARGESAYKNHCASAILSNVWAITSAHCVNEPQASYRVVADRSNTIPFITKVKPSVHGEYKLFKPYQADIALLKPLRPFNIGNPHYNLTSSCLPSTEIEDKVLGSASFLGWDDLHNGTDVLPNLRLSEVCIMTDDECRRSIASSTDGKTICTKHDEHVRRFCEASKGGMLFKEILNKAVLIGLVTNCGSPDKPVVYTEISHFIDWINFTTKGAKAS